jgi:hypothetical protein
VEVTEVWVLEVANARIETWVLMRILLEVVQVTLRRILALPRQPEIVNRIFLVLPFWSGPYGSWERCTVSQYRIWWPTISRYRRLGLGGETAESAALLKCYDLGFACMLHSIEDAVYSLRHIMRNEYTLIDGHWRDLRYISRYVRLGE